MVNQKEKAAVTLQLQERTADSAHTYLNWYPFLIGQGRPDVMGFSDGGLVWFENDLCSVSIHVQGSENEDQTREGGV